MYRVFRTSDQPLSATSRSSASPVPLTERVPSSCGVYRDIPGMALWRLHIIRNCICAAYILECSVTMLQYCCCVLCTDVRLQGHGSRHCEPKGGATRSLNHAQSSSVVCTSILQGKHLVYIVHTVDQGGVRVKNRNTKCSKLVNLCACSGATTAVWCGILCSGAVPCGILVYYVVCFVVE